MKDGEGVLGKDVRQKGGGDDIGISLESHVYIMCVSMSCAISKSIRILKMRIPHHAFS